MTVEEFEKDLKEQVKGHDIVMAIKEHEHQSRVDWLKNKTGFEIEVLGRVINDTKLKYRAALERVDMRVSEIESRMLNYHLSEKETEKLFFGGKEGEQFRSI